MVDHPNIVKLHDISEEKNRYYIVTELCEGGDLFTRLERHRRFSEKDAINMLKQILAGIDYLHGKNIIHRDLKPENILLFGQNSQVKISDFGSSIIHNSQLPLTQIAGTPYYTAPEVLNENYSNKCDIWSIGVITYILLSGMAPFYGRTNRDIIKMIRKGVFRFEGQVWDKISDICKDFICTLLTLK